MGSSVRPRQIRVIYDALEPTPRSNQAGSGKSLSPVAGWNSGQFSAPSAGRMKKTKKPKRKPGRPQTRIIKLDATPEEVTQQMFANAKPPDPSIRVFNRPKK